MPTPTIPVELVAGVWPAPDGAGAAMRSWVGKGLVEAAILVVDRTGKVHLGQTWSRQTRSAMVVGGLLAAGLGMLTTGSGWLRLSGAAITSLAAQARALGLADERLTALGDRMTPNSSTLVAVVEASWVADVERQLAADGADVVTEPVNTRVHDSLTISPGVAYTRGDVAGDVIAVRTKHPGRLRDNPAAHHS